MADETKFHVLGNEFSALITAYLENGSKLKLPVQGVSMVPFLRPKRDMVVLQHQTSSHKKGDIVFYQRESGQCVLHRIYKQDAPDRYTMLGDGQIAPETPVYAKQIFAQTTYVIRKGKMITPSSLQWKFYSFLSRRIFLKRIYFYYKKKRGLKNTHLYE